MCGNFPKPVVRKILSLASNFSTSIIIGCNSLNNAAALQIQFKMADFQLNVVHRSSSIPQAKSKQVDESSYLYIREIRSQLAIQFYFLAPLGTQGVTFSVRSSNCSFEELQAVSQPSFNSHSVSLHTIGALNTLTRFVKFVALSC